MLCAPTLCARTWGGFCSDMCELTFCNFLPNRHQNNKAQSTHSRNFCHVLAGYGQNKIVHIAHMNASGFKFVVLGNAFIIHR